MTRTDIVRLLDKIEDNNGPVMADRTLARRVMTWHAPRTDHFSSPIISGMVRASAKERERDRVLSDDELKAIWTATEKGAPFHRYVRFILTHRGEAQ